MMMMMKFGFGENDESEKKVWAEFQKCRKNFLKPRNFFLMVI